jgi:hypothetical protein
MTAAPWLVAVAASCQFPDYQFSGQSAAGSASSAGANTGGDAQGGLPPSGGSAGSESGAAGAPSSVGAGGDGGNGPDPCGVRPAPAPDSCFDGAQGWQSGPPQSTSVSSSPCATGACNADADCLVGTCAGTCSAPLRVEYLCGDPNRTIKSPRFQLKLWNDDDDAIELSEIVLRYYFRRNGVSEPIHATNTQSIWFQGSTPVNVTAETTTTISRFNADDDDDFDAYLEIGFTEHTLLPGDRVEIYQEFLGGNDNGVVFDQGTHYSFDESVLAFADYSKITAYRNGVHSWGLEPRRGGDESCFARAVNLNGGALVVDGDSWESTTGALVSAEGSAFSGQPAAVFPPVQGALAQALSTGFRLTASQDVAMPVENGDYLVYVYAVSGAEAESGTIGIEGSGELDEFQALLIDNAPAWLKLGPYPISVSDGVLDVTCLSRGIRLAAIELRTPGTAAY